MSLLIVGLVLVALLVVVVVGAAARLVLDDGVKLLCEHGQDVVEHREEGAELGLCEARGLEDPQRRRQGLEGVGEDVVAGLPGDVLEEVLEEHVPDGVDGLGRDHC